MSTRDLLSNLQPLSRLRLSLSSSGLLFFFSQARCEPAAWLIRGSELECVRKWSNAPISKLRRCNRTGVSKIPAAPVKCLQIGALFHR